MSQNFDGYAFVVVLLIAIMTKAGFLIGVGALSVWVVVKILQSMGVM